MRRLLGSLVFKVGSLFLLGALALQFAIVVAVLWPDGRPLVFRLIDLGETREIVEAVEAVRPDQQSTLIAAVTNGDLIVELLPHYPAPVLEKGARRLDARIEAQFARHAEELAGRRYHVDLGNISGAFPPSVDSAPMRLIVELRTGQAIAIERAPVILRIIATRYAAIAAVIAAVLLAIMLILTWQVVRPISRLAAGVDAFRRDVKSKDVAPEGTAEVRELAVAFNAMKQQISGLVAERTRVLAAIAHDLRTYLTRLRLRADFIDDSQQRIKAVADLAEMEQLLDDILLFARSDASGDVAVPVIDAQAIATDYVAIRREVGDAVVFAGEAAPAYCRCAPLAFRRILGNLIDNAIRYGETATVCITGGDAMVLTIEDQGPGIPPERVEQLTSPFERLEPSRGRTTGGAGLGLAIVKALVETHGGTIVFMNLGGGGLRVTVRLPPLGRIGGPTVP